ncbi:hypothetical protein, partial [uncultured Sneathiella sp.]|uniref:[protein-PII] uridylyltransferase family protein n=1 Tax=uncultured Sneathiella sp. TaxID=879315 RepID=UPI0030DC6903
SYQMTPDSDADLIFLFQTPKKDMTTDGRKPVSAGVFYNRLSQRYINAISVFTGEGQLYEVDMRLRPHGKSGPIVLPLDAFVKYYQEDAWTWEHLALTRARVVAGDRKLAARTEAALRGLREIPRDTDEIRKDTFAMRERVQKELGSSSVWAIKHAAGGLMDLEFLCQYLRLIHGAEHPEILETNSSDALHEMQKAELIPAAEAERLIAISGLYLNISGLQQLCLGSRNLDDDIPLALKTALAEVGQVDTFDDLANKLKESQEYVDKLLGKYLGSPDAASDAGT